MRACVCASHTHTHTHTHTHEQRPVETWLPWLDDDAKVWKGRQEEGGLDGGDPKQRGTRGLTCWLLIARFYFISFFATRWVRRGDLAGFDGHVSLLLLIGRSHSERRVVMQNPILPPPCDSVLMIVIECVVIKKKKKKKKKRVGEKKAIFVGKVREKGRRREGARDRSDDPLKVKTGSSAFDTPSTVKQDGIIEIA